MPPTSNGSKKSTAAPTRDFMSQKAAEAMTAIQKAALLAISTAAAALSASAQALAASFEPGAGAEPEPAKKKEPAAKKEAPAAAPPAEKPAAAPEAKKDPPPAAAETLEAQCRKAAKGYAEVYGREGLKGVLSQFTQGTLADVPADKLPELLKALS